MARTIGREPLSMDGLFRELGALAEKRSELLAAEAHLWAQAARLLSDAAEVVTSTLHHPTTSFTAPGDDEKHLLPVDAAATYLNLSRATLDKWRVQGGGPEFVRIGRRIFYRQATLEAFIASKTFPHTSAYDRS